MLEHLNILQAVAGLTKSGPRELSKMHLEEGHNLLYLSISDRNPGSTEASVDLASAEGSL
jgi:hypothetical protein